MRCPLPRLSRKKHRMPQKMQRQAMMSSRFGFSWKNRQRMRITKSGAVNCNKMVLAAVVSLLAAVYSEVVPHMAMAPMSTPLVNFGLWWVSLANSSRIHTEMMLRKELMDKGSHGIILTHSPPMLNSRAAQKTNRSPFFEDMGNALLSCLGDTGEITPVPAPAPGRPGCPSRPRCLRTGG